MMRQILIDLDGVIYQGDEPVPGAREAVIWLEQRGIPHLFLTNTTSRPIAALMEKLARLGIPSAPDSFLTPAVAVREWLRTEGGAGLPALFVPGATKEDLPASAPERAVDLSAVVLGDLGEAWDFATMNRVLNALMSDARPPLLAMGMTRYWRAPDGLRLDVGSFAKAFEYATGCRVVVLGKPSVEFFATAVARLGGAAAETVMIGDDIKGDVKGAQAAGLRGLLVRTGKFRPADLQGDIVPDTILDSIADLPAWWEERSGLT